jgi:hypothetical protein
MNRILLLIFYKNQSYFVMMLFSLPGLLSSDLYALQAVIRYVLVNVLTVSVTVMNLAPHAACVR